MQARSEIFTQTVQVLRELSTHHAAAARRMCGRAGACDAKAEPDVARAGTMLEDLEDRALLSLCSLARATSDDLAFDAIDEARADWLRAVILNRAVESALR